MRLDEYVQFQQDVRICALRVYKTALRKNGIRAWTGFDSIKQHFNYCGGMTGVLNKVKKS